MLSIVFCMFVFNVQAESEENRFIVATSVDDNVATISITYEQVTNMCGGSFSFVYDASNLLFLGYEAGNEIKDITHFVNENYAENKIRVNWVSTTAFPTSGDLFTLKFSLLSDEFGEADISLEKLKVADSNGDKLDVSYELKKDVNVPVTNNGSTSTGTNRKPVSENNISSTSEIENSIVFSELPFIDIKSNDWFYESVMYAYDNNLMKGISETEFAPQNNVTRAMLVTVLYRIEKEPATNRSIPYRDVDMGAYYGNAVSWAMQNSIVTGISENEFAPDVNITREQIAAIMHRYAQYKGYDVSVGENTNILSYDDAENISEYAIASMQYVVGSGLIKGKSVTTLNPLDNATRAEIAAILQRFTEINK